MPTGMFRDCSTGALKADGSPQDQACFDQGVEADNLTPVDKAVYYHTWADKCPIQDDPLCPTVDAVGCLSAADCYCPTGVLGGWTTGWCDEGKCWYVDLLSYSLSPSLASVQ